MKNIGYKNLISYQKANQLAHLIYDLTINFPKEEIYGLVSQMRRAALSVCANLAEGYSRPSKKDRKHFYQIAVGSLTELEFFEEFSYNRKYINQENYDKLYSLHDETARILNGLVRSTGLSTLISNSQNI